MEDNLLGQFGLSRVSRHGGTYHPLDGATLLGALTAHQPDDKLIAYGAPTTARHLTALYNSEELPLWARVRLDSLIAIAQNDELTSPLIGRV